MSGVLTDHFSLMVLLATLYSAFLALLWRDGARERKRFFLRVFVALVGGGLAAAWLMYLW